MTVKCLDITEKEFIIQRFIDKVYTLEELAELNSCSRRTIIRVLQEHNVDPGLRKRKVKAKLPPMPTMVLPAFEPLWMKATEPAPKPWWKRAGRAVMENLANLGRVLS